jgi:hypothetical protein
MNTARMESGNGLASLYREGRGGGVPFAVLSMPRIDLQVPFPEKDEAKRLGARWDAQLKRWYIPEGTDHTAFNKWLPKPPSPPNIRAPFWYLASSMRECWRCEVPSSVFAIMLPPGYEALNIADDPADDCWMDSDSSTLLSYLSDVPGSVAAQLRERAPRYRLDYSQTTHSFYWMNHCEHCQAKLGDFETMQEPGTFYTYDATGPKNLVLTQIDEPFAAACGSYTL